MKLMEDFIYTNYIAPILDKTGYNSINTLTYAVIALISLYLIRAVFKKYNINVDRKFVYSVIPFVLFGSTFRVVTDSIDAGTFKAITPIHDLILKSHIYDYGYLTVSPGIYILTAFILFASLFILRKLKLENYLLHVGLILWLFHFLLVLPFFKHLLITIPIIVLAAIPFLLIYKIYKDKTYALMGFAHGLDGAATFITLDFSEQLLGLKYFEQHYVSNAVCQMFGTCGTFYLLKAALAFLAVYVIDKEKVDDFDKNYFALIIIIMGLAPGLRDMLRLIAGT